MKLDDARLLLAIKNFGTIRAAANHLYISQPAVSQRLKQIEAYWDTLLFIRTTKKMVLTPEGEHVIAYAAAVLEQERLVSEAIHASSKEVTGTLTLGVSSMIGQYLLPGLLQQYMQLYPKVRIQLETGLSQVIAKRSFHLSICRGQNRLDQTNLLLVEDPLYFVSRKGMKVDHYIAFQTEGEYQALIRQWMQTQQLNLSQTIQVDQMETCKQLMVKGIGKAVLSKIAIQDLDDSHYQIEPMMLEGKALSRPTWLSYADEMIHLPQVKAFIDITKQYVTSITS